MNPLGVGSVGFDVEFHDTWGFVGMDGLYWLLCLGPVFFLRFDQSDNFFARGNLALPPVRTFDGEIVHASDESVTQERLRDFLGFFLVLVSDVN